jgi:hypothetical protein
VIEVLRMQSGIWPPVNMLFSVIREFSAVLWHAMFVSFSELMGDI